MSTSSGSEHVKDGLLAHLAIQLRPSLAKYLTKGGVIETAVYGLGQQGRRHALLMREYGAPVAAAIHPGHGAAVLHESIPVYASMAEMLRAHPHIAVVSIWKHFATATDAALEAIEARIPIVVLIAEGIPVQDAQRLRAAAHRCNVLLFGPNTPGIIFPPERIKAGMLPDVFYPAEPEPGVFTSEGVTITSRSGAILYHLSDALAASGIALNGVLGIGGDAVVGSDFVDVVPRVMSYPNTHAVVIAGEIGGCKEELFAEAMRAQPERFPKPVVALLSGRCAPTGKTMGHAGAIIAPGANYGTYAAKKTALESVGVTVVNSQTDLVKAVKKALGGRTYFDPARYRAHMKTLWEEPPRKTGWTTSITRVEPNVLMVRGVPLQDLINGASLVACTALMIEGAIPDKRACSKLEALGCELALLPAARMTLPKDAPISQRAATLFLADAPFAAFTGTDAEWGIACVARMCACVAKSLGHTLPDSGDFGALCATALVGKPARDPALRKLLEAILAASIDHGVTPPSAQATILAASVRATMQAAVANGTCAITHVHGGAGREAAEFFLACLERSRRDAIPPREAAELILRERMAEGRRIEGLGHRVHTEDPRRDPLWRLADKLHRSGPAVALSRDLEEIATTVRGMRLPINVDGVIGAIIADCGLPPITASALFVLGRSAGLAAHYIEEIRTQQPMRQIDFRQAVYRGK
ncbi:MAG: hypothetical protein HYV27_15655 [Candidatus Hydrogenedentes bacterium]|nr:hypothetical protein [Candidatus Hydrogenedentota bacterium]